MSSILAPGNRIDDEYKEIIMDAVIKKAQVLASVALIGLGAGCSERNSERPEDTQPTGHELSVADMPSPFIFDQNPALAFSPRTTDSNEVREIARSYREDISTNGSISLDAEQGNLLFEMLTEAEESMSHHDVDNKVALLQACLALAEQLPVSGIDGIYLQGTWKAVGSDEAGLRTMSRLAAELIPSGRIQFKDAEMARRVAVITPLLGRITVDYDRSMLSFSNGNETREEEASVMALQIALHEMGYLPASGIDGDLGRKTMQAVNTFREAHNDSCPTGQALEITDAVGRRTNRALIRSYIFQPAAAE
jgi:hypothetical protein